MKKTLFVTGTLAMMVAMISCGGPRKEEGRVYMPDMAYSRAYETYASTEALDKAGVHYTAKPVEGTVAVASNSVPSPFCICTVPLAELPLATLN